jgi:phage repressor protein C with HTH and peptisase S24 domain
MDTLREARERVGLTQAELAEAVGTTQPQIGRLENSKRKLSKEWAERLAPHLKVAPTQLMFPRGGAVLIAPAVDDREIPVYSAVEGGKGEFVVSSDEIERVARPWYLKGIKEGYAVVITGESMEPAFEPGDYAVVNPRAPLMKGKHAIFVAGEARGEFRASIKRLLQQSDKAWRVEQYNPRKVFDLPKAEWASAYRVVGKHDG